MQRKRILITGATSGIGLAAATALVSAGADIAIVGRDEARTKAVRERLARSTGGTVDMHVADLSSQAAVRGLAAEVLAAYPKLDVLVNNAGAMYADRQLSVDGIELTWAVNHLAPFLLTNLLLERLTASAPSRVVTTAGLGHRFAGVPFDDLNAERSYASVRRYCETKLANVLFTAELARRLEGSGVTANCFHPGVVASGFYRRTGGLTHALMLPLLPFMRTPEQGAETLVWLATSPDASAENGGYFADKRRRTPSAAARDAGLAERLWAVSAAQVGLGHHTATDLPPARRPASQ